ncbi:Coenzyme F420 hydrogenase/dehydrogenase, beta subunit C-terminal domain [Agromyces albus]|uniref:Coenzyme F420 hydrogenase n=1 Tax=Agromyces albus TaxID=205332 RepID=A0A4V1QY80_9MICO|nr:Coenzyme F420 hydrogenase/dehydrogenase, beta subunit C-terminal domain [Agromyces albus]RXZ72226.1 coenzyme F420 hydrogenase [Agromyces albus]
MTTKLERAVQRVVRAENCAGCGVCPLISDRLEMELSDDGFLRPSVRDTPTDRDDDAAEASLFAKVCPGMRLTARRLPEQQQHPILGRYVEAWQGWAVDEEIRRAGSSGGVLTALSDWLVSSGRAPAVRASGMGAERPTTTVSVRITTREEAIASAGSRYAPVSNARRDDEPDPFVGKPCEVSAMHNLATQGGSGSEPPLLLSFFCAGTPSQKATDRLVEELGGHADRVSNLRYRGDGWPGSFKFSTSDGVVGEMSYQMSWGKRLGREVQLRCKICPDGTGEHADIAVGDYWDADENGFPMFTEAFGNSVVIARTQRGAEILRAASEDGVIMLSSIDLDDVASVQPLQKLRRRTIGGRLVGRMIGGVRIPRYRGYGILHRLATNLFDNVRAAAGTFARTVGVRQ